MSKIYCSNCGKLIAANSKYCWNCGAAQHGFDSAAYQAKAPALDHATAPIPEATKAAAQPDLYNKTVKRRHLDPSAKWLFFLNYIGKTFLLVPAFLVGMYYQPLVAAGFIAYLVINYLIATLVYNHFWFDIEKLRLDIEYGIIHKRHVSVPFSEIQNVNITRSLIDRTLGIAKLEIESAGSTGTTKRDVIGGTKSKAEGFLPGLSMKDALNFHDMILQKALHEQHRKG